MFSVLFSYSLAISDEDTYGRIKAGYNTLSLIKEKRYYKVDSGYTLVFLPEDLNRYTGVAHADGVETDLFENNSFAVHFKGRGYLEISSEKYTSLTTIAYSTFKYPSCDTTIVQIGEGSYTVGCSEGSNMSVTKGKSVCVYYAFPKDTSVAILSPKPTLSQTTYFPYGDTSKLTNISSAFMLRVTGSNKCNGEVSGANVSYSTPAPIVNMILSPDGPYFLVHVGRFAGWIAVVVVVSIVSVVVLAGLVVASVVIGICCYHCIKEKMMHAPDQAQLELGIIEIPPADYQIYESKNPLSTHSTSVDF